MTQLVARLAQSDAEVAAAQRLRHDVFGSMFQQHRPAGRAADGADKDAFDAVAHHLVLVDQARDNAIVGTYRIITQDAAQMAGGFYSQAEFDLSKLLSASGTVAELGRSCIAPEYRGGTGLMLMWQALGAFVADHNIETLFGVASFSGTDPAAFAQPLTYLHHHARADADIRPVAHGDNAGRMDLLAPEKIDRRAAMLQMPGLIKAYLRLGGRVGDGVYIDHEFQSVDVCMMLQTATMAARQSALFGAGENRVG